MPLSPNDATSSSERFAREGTIREPAGDLSVLQLGAILLRNRWIIIGLMLIMGGLAASLTWRRPLRYEASASFIPQSNTSSGGGLSSLAGQIGLAIPAENLTESPDFYVELLTSRVILRPIVLDTLVVPERGAQPTPLLVLLRIRPERDEVRLEEGLEVLGSMVKPSRDSNTGIVRVSVTTQWPSVSAYLVNALIEGITDFNQQTRQGQAAVERQFIEERLSLASAELRSSEDRLASFMSNNRLIEGSPQLLFERERLQRDIALDQQVFTTLTQAYEEARIREVRATPLITIIEEPTLPALPEPRGRTRNTVVGLMVGALLGVVIALLREWRRQLRFADQAIMRRLQGTV